MVGAHARLCGVLRLLENTAATIAGIALLSAMVLVTCDAVLRHVFSAPLTFQLQLTESYLMVIGIMLALPWGYRTGGRIRIMALLNVLRPAVRAAVYRAGLLASAIYLFLLGWRALLIAQEAFVKNELIMGVIDWPVGWSWVWVPIGCFLLAVRLMVDAAAPALTELNAQF